MKGLKILIVSALLFSCFSAWAESLQKTKIPFHSSHTGEQTESSYLEFSNKKIKQVQRSLNQNGHNLQIDGILGPNTKMALRDFQKKHRLLASGSLTPNTLSTLGIENATASQTRKPASIQQDPSSLEVEEDDQRFREKLKKEKELDYEELDVEIPINSTPIDNY